MKRIFSPVVFFGLSVVAAISASPAAAKVYTLVPDSPEFDDSPYGFSGTITTDGSLGDISDVSFITDWNITLETPGDVDGITMQTLTPASGSSVDLSRGGPNSGFPGTIHVTPTSLSILFSNSYSPSVFSLIGPAPGDEAIRFVGPSYAIVGLLMAPGDLPFPPLIVRGYLYVTDPDEVPNTHFSHIGLGYDVIHELVFATAVVPEPPSLILLWMMGVVGLGLRRTRRVPLGVQRADGEVGKSTKKPNSRSTAAPHSRRKVMTSSHESNHRNPVRKHRAMFWWTSAVANMLCLMSQQTNLHAATVRTVALTGLSAPGAAPDVTYDTFGAYETGFSVFIFRGPVLNDAGQVAFRANLSGSGVGATNKVGIWSEGSGNLALVARTGSSAPGGGTFGTNSQTSDLELFSPNLNEAGQTAFWGGLTNGNLGIWSEGSGNLALVARDGTPAPGTLAGVSFWFAGLIPDFAPVLFDNPPLLSNAGQTAFTGALKGSGTNSTNNAGIWSEGSGSLAQVVRAGDQAVGLPGGVNYDVSFTFGLNDAGQSAVFSRLAGSGVDETNWEGYWTGTPGDLALVERAGNPAPGIPDGVNLGSLFASHGFNNAGQIAIDSFLTGNVDSTNDEGLWSNASGSLELVARRGSQAAGAPAGVDYGMFSLSGWPVLNDSGQVAFRAELAGSGVTVNNSRGIWSGGTDELALIARTGEPAPGTTSNVNFSDLHYPALNSSGQVAFRADLTGSGVDPTNDKSIWATDQYGDLQLIARSGDMLEVAPGDFRTLGDVNFSSMSGNSDGRSSGFNNFGQLVFWASFTDESQGVFVSNAVAHIPGDFNNDGDVDGRDFLAWQRGASPEPLSAADLADWQDHYGSSLSFGSSLALASAQTLSANVPEPTSIAFVAAALSILLLRVLRRPPLS